MPTTRIGRKGCTTTALLHQTSLLGSYILLASSTSSLHTGWRTIITFSVCFRYLSTGFRRLCLFRARLFLTKTGDDAKLGNRSDCPGRGKPCSCRSKQYDVKRTATPILSSRGSTRTISPWHWRRTGPSGSAYSSTSENLNVIPRRKDRSVSKNTPEVLMSRVRPVPCFSSTGRAVRYRRACRLLVTSVVFSTAAIIGIGHWEGQFTVRYIFLYLGRYRSGSNEYSHGGGKG
jgi:hypothetical protein